MRWSAIISLAAGALCRSTSASTPSDWFVAQNPHFESYSQSGPERAKFNLTRFEALRAFFGVNRSVYRFYQSQEAPPIRVVEFKTALEYAPGTLAGNADAYYSANETREYIVLPTPARDDFSVAAHEYAHAVLHANRLKLPPWLSEGVGELFSTVAITNDSCELGGPIEGNMQTLRRDPWLPAPEFFGVTSTAFPTRAEAAVFYAESWAMTDMLSQAPEYAPRFAELVDALNSGIETPIALAKLYGKSPQTILNRAREWIRHGASPRTRLPAIGQIEAGAGAYPVTELQSQMLIADLLVTNGNWERAERIYKQLQARTPADPNVLAALGNLALRKGDLQIAAKYWGMALEAGLQDAALCYRYSLAADRVNLPAEQIETALERAVALQPKFDDARFKLAMLKNNQDNYAAAVTHLQAMTRVPPARAYGYWTALSYALGQLGKRNEAALAARQAKRFASNPEEQAHAEQLAYVAQTEMSVQFTRDAAGNLQLVTTRIPHGTSGRNPFVEAEDHIRTESGRLREVRCSNGKLTGFLFENAHSQLQLSVSDPTRISIENGPSEFTCGPQAARNVRVEYATTSDAGRGVLRGMSF